MLPILFDSSFFTLYSYPLFMGLSWGLGYRFSEYLLLKKNLTLKGFGLLYWGIFLFSWLGSKIFYLMYSSGGELQNHSQSLSFWLGGGFVFYGGLIFGLIYLLLYCLVFKKYPIKEAYIFFAPLTFGHALGRIGCFLAGCCYGTYCDLPWKIHLHGHFRHPVQLYEASLLILLGMILLKETLKKDTNPLKLVGIYFLGYSMIRFILEFLRGDIIRGLHFGLSTSQWISLVFFLGATTYLGRLSRR